MPAVRTPRPHPLSQAFAWQDRTVAAPRRVTAEQQRAFNERGFVRIEAVFTAGEIAEVVAAIEPLEPIAEAKLREAGGRISISDADAIPFTPHIARVSPALRALARHPAVLDLCYDLLGDDVRLYWDQSVYKKWQKPQ